jgi:hypothetical protein
MFREPFTRRDQKIIQAIKDGNIQVLEGLNPEEKASQGSSMLVLASELGRLDVVKVLLKWNDININHQNELRNTALILASELGHFDIVKILLGCNGMNVNLQNDSGNTALLSASIHGHLDIVKALLGCEGINVSISNRFGDTALIRARTNGFTEIVRCLDTAFENNDLSSGNIHMKCTGDLVAQSRKNLLTAMTDSSSDPACIAMEYVNHCITDQVLGRGAFGVVYLGTDTKLPKKFVIKKVKLANGDEEAISDIFQGFHTEISVSHLWPKMNIDYNRCMSEFNYEMCLTLGSEEIPAS